MKKSKKVAIRLKKRIADWSILPSSGAIHGGNTKILPGGYAFRKPGSQNFR